MVSPAICPLVVILNVTDILRYRGRGGNNHNINIYYLQLFFTWWQCTIYNIPNKFTSVGLYEKHVVAIWNFGNHLSICY
jgi:hypothetical protein